YVLTHRGQRGQSFEYELLYDGDGSGAAHLAGLLDATTIGSSRGQVAGFAGLTRPQPGADAGASRRDENAAQAGSAGLSGSEAMTRDQLHVYEHEQAAS
ncbi:hypothetical protein DF117_36070, partial [Burkholderia stagnalis]